LLVYWLLLYCCVAVYATAVFCTDLPLLLFAFQIPGTQIDTLTNRNNNIFNSASASVNPLNVYNQAAQYYYLTTSLNPKQKITTGTPIKRQPPPQGFYKLNIDGAFDKHNHMAGAAGVFHNAFGAWVYGFTKPLSDTDILQAELLALYHGLQLAHHRNLRPLQVETDSQVDVLGSLGDSAATHI
uniref:Uncharacterized protein LOC104213032 n=1 Tax=Nicotiana sylvestris TaxID=4096 RepID=A0A1U7UXG8_NICSY